MMIEKDKVAELHYKLYEGDTLLEDSAKGDPLLYLHGHGGIFEKIERALDGKQKGDSLEVTLQPFEAYGERQDNAVQRVPIKYLMPKRKPRVGEVFQVNTENGPTQVLILKLGKFNVDVDLNHPFAGKVLRFEIDIRGVREASKAELDHGHAHCWRASTLTIWSVRSDSAKTLYRTVKRQFRATCRKPFIIKPGLTVFLCLPLFCWSG